MGFEKFVSHLHDDNISLTILKPLCFFRRALAFRYVAHPFVSPTKSVLDLGALHFRGKAKLNAKMGEFMPCVSAPAYEFDFFLFIYVLKA